MNWFGSWWFGSAWFDSRWFGGTGGGGTPPSASIYQQSVRIPGWVNDATSIAF